MNGRSARNRKLALDPPHDRVDTVVGAEAGGEAVTTAALGLGDAAHVDLSERPQAHADSAVGLLFEDARDLGLGGAAQDVDKALDLLDRDPMLREVALGHRSPDEAPLGDEVRAVQRVAEELEIREPVLLEQRATQA